MHPPPYGAIVTAYTTSMSVIVNVLSYFVICDSFFFLHISESLVDCSYKFPTMRWELVVTTN